MNEPTILPALSCADDYDPNSMPVPKAREVIAFRKPRVANDREAFGGLVGFFLDDTKFGCEFLVSSMVIL